MKNKSTDQKEELRWLSSLAGCFLPSYFICNITFLLKCDAVTEAESEFLFQEKQ